jgi:hypothetical protein
MKWLAGLFGHLGERLDQGRCDNTMRLAAKYLSDKCGDLDEALDWLARRGGFCDCEVLLNVEPPDDGDAIRASTRAYERIIEAAERHQKAKKRMR